MNGLAEKIQTTSMHPSEAVIWATGRLLALAMGSTNEILKVIAEQPDMPAVEVENAKLLVQAMRGFCSVFQDDITRYMNISVLVK
jgi:hypothetical protein